MSCNGPEKMCRGAAHVAGVPQSDAEWSAGRRDGEHCPKCGGWLTEAGGCNNPQCGGGMLRYVGRQGMPVVHPDVDSYIKWNRGGPVGRDIEDRWRNRVEPNRWQYRGYAGATDYLRQYGKTIGEDKARALADCAENKGYSDMARGFWEKAYEIHRRTTRNMATVPVPPAPVPNPAVQPPTPATTPPVQPATNGDGYCPDCGGRLRVAPGEQDWCTECMNMVTAADQPQQPAAVAPVQPAPVPATINDYAQSARELQDEKPSDKRNAIQRKVKSVGYGAIRLALRSVGVPGGGAQDENITNMVWQYLDRCDLCKAWVSPKNGVCKNPRCADKGKQVGQMRTWPPEAVKWVPYREEVGQVIQPGQAHVISKQARQAAAERRLESAEKAKQLAQGLMEITPVSPSQSPVQPASAGSATQPKPRKAKTNPSPAPAQSPVIAGADAPPHARMPSRDEAAKIAGDGLEEYADRRKQTGWDDLSELEKEAWQTGFNAYQSRMAAGDGYIPDDKADAEIVGTAEEWVMKNVEEDDHHHAEPAYINGFRTARKKLGQYANEYAKQGGSQCPNCGNFIIDGQGHKAGCGQSAQSNNGSGDPVSPGNTSSNGKTLFSDFTDRLTAAGKKYGVSVPNEGLVSDLIDDGRSPEAWAFQRRVEALVESDLPGVHPDDVLIRLGDDEEILSFINQDGTPDEFIDRHCEKYGLDRLTDDDTPLRGKPLGGPRMVGSIGKS